MFQLSFKSNYSLNFEVPLEKMYVSVSERVKESEKRLNWLSQRMDLIGILQS